jgi:hypothetical protein
MEPEQLVGLTLREFSQKVTVDGVERAGDHVVYYVTVKSKGEPPDFFGRRLPETRKCVRIDMDLNYAMERVDKKRHGSRVTQVDRPQTGPVADVVVLPADGDQTP